MSIIAAAATSPTTPFAATQPLEPSASLLAGSLAFAAIVIAVAWFTRVFRPRVLTLPDRIPLGHSAGFLVIVTVVGAAAWLGTQIVYVAYRVFQIMAANGGQMPEGFDESMLEPSDIAVLATVPPAIGLLTLLVGDWLVGRRRTAEGLGYDAAKLGPGVKLGLLAMVFTLPLLFALGLALEQFYGLVGYEHPREHMLLKVLGEASTPLARAMIVVGAVLGAPLCEELLFRAHLQTLMRRLVMRMFKRPPPATAEPLPMPRPVAVRFDPLMPPPALPPLAEFAASVPAPVPPPGDVPAAVPPLTLTPDRPPPGQPAWTAWVAILVTSLVFALIHETWSAPLIFALSVCFGYAYERTNNLWVTITMHAVFNGLNTALFLLGATQG
jgi:membrane protease YdiL (CAAX protease family)